MTKEQKKAIEKIKRQITIGECEKNIGIPVYISDLKTILSMLEEQYKIIDLMTNELALYCEINCEEDIKTNKEQIRKYFENKAKEK